MLRQYKFLRKILKGAKSRDYAVGLLAGIEKLRKVITRPERIRVHLSTDVKELVKHSDPVDPWLEILFKDMGSVSPERF